MTATNHALTGALIGLWSGKPLVAVPAALFSHFLLDMIPHFGPRMSVVQWLRTQRFRWMLAADFLGCVTVVILLFVHKPSHWLLACFTAFIATSPDLISYPFFKRAQQDDDAERFNWYTKFASCIQWFERPPGAIVELAWLIGASVLLWQFLR